jgi:hypothetical protein
MAIQYYMRGYNTSAPGTVGYVDWVVNDAPDSTATYVPAPYISGNIINITVNRVVTSKVDNFLKPNESLAAIGNPGADGNFFHINSYDWLHSTPPGPPIPVPSYLIGLSMVRGSADGITPRDYATLFWAEGAGKWLFAYNTDGDGITIGAALPVGMGSLSVDGYIEVGTDPAQSGIIRIPNNQFIVSRNADNTGDGYLIGQDTLNRVRLGSPPGNEIYIPADLRVDGYIRDGGTFPATTGFVRNSNNTAIITFRNSINSLNITALSSTAGDLIVLGDALNSGVRFNTATGFEHIFEVNSINLARVGNVGGTTYFKFEGGASNPAPFPTITQASTTSGSGQALRIQAQSTSSAPDFGGPVIISSGSGPTADGYVDLRINNVPKLRVFGPTAPTVTDFAQGATNNPNSFQLFNNTVRWYNTVTSPTITQDQVNTTAQPMLIKAQRANAVAFLGGDLRLSSGGGNAVLESAAGYLHSLDGYVRLQTGTVDRLFIDATSRVATLTLNTFSFNGLDGGFNQDDSLGPITNPLINQRSDNRNSITGQPFTVRAQDTTGTTTIGGSLHLSSGQGTSADGYVRVQTNGFTREIWDATANRATLTLNTWAFNGVDGTFDASSIGVVTNPTITQRDDIQNGVTGQPLTIKSQSTPGTTAIAGNLVLNTGTGTAISPASSSGPAYTKHGHLFLKIGTNLTNNVGDFFIDGYGPYISIGGSTTAPAAIDGYVRVPNNVWAVSAARNPASPPNASIHLIGTNATNQILIGESTDTTYIPGTLLVGTFNSSTVLEVEDRLIHANFNVAQAGVPVNPPSLITGLTIHRGNNAVPVYNDEAGWIWVEGVNINASDGYWKAASVLSGNDLNLATSLNMMGRALSVTDHPNSITAANPNPPGGALPTVGGLRTLNGSTAVSSRNALGTQNLLLLGTDGYDKIVMGDTTSPFNTGFIFNTTANSIFDFQYVGVGNKIAIGDGYIRAGATPSLTGIFRNTQTASVSNPIVTSRNFSGTLDMILLGTDGYDKIVHGASAVNTGHVFNTSLTSIYDFQVNGVSNVQLGAGEIDADGYAETIAIGATVLSPRLFQITLPGTGSVDGYSFKINAQPGQQQTGGNANTNGGILVLGSGPAGTGGSGAAGKDGYVDIFNGNNLTAQFFNADFDADGYSEFMGIGATVIAPKIYQFVKPGTGATDGYNFKVIAQPGQQQTGGNANNKGGNLFLGGGFAGTGGSGAAGTDGYVALMSGAKVIATAGPDKFIYNTGRRRHVTPVSTTYQVLVSDDYLAVNSATIYTVTLPATPSLGDTYEFKDINGTATTNNVTIAGNGNNIDGAATLVMNTNFASFVVTYTGAQWSVS